MRTKLNERASRELLEVMSLYGFASTNHTLNVIISKALTDMKTNTHTHSNEVNINDQRNTTLH